MLTKEQALEIIKKAQTSDDTEMAHIDADYALCGLLKWLGHEDVVREYRKVGKWYA